MRGYHRDTFLEPEARAENVRVQNEINDGPVWPYERQNWERWKRLGQPKDMQIILGDGTIFWSKGTPVVERRDLPEFHVKHQGNIYWGWGRPSLEPYG